MSASPALLVRSWPVGTWTATLTVGPLEAGRPVHVLIEWDPAQPARLTSDQLQQYRAGRDAALRELSELTGLRVAVLDS